MLRLRADRLTPRRSSRALASAESSVVVAPTPPPTRSLTRRGAPQQKPGAGRRGGVGTSTHLRTPAVGWVAGGESRGLGTMYWCLAAARQPPAALQGKVCVRVPAGWRPRGGLPVRSRGGGGDTGPTFGGGGWGDGEAAAAPCHLDTHTRCSPSWRRAGVTREVETRAGLWRQGRRGGLHGAVCGCGDWQPPASGWPQA